MSVQKVAVVTGSNKGIGYAIVKELCSKYDGVVYLTARDEGRGKNAVSELNKIGLKPLFHQLDIDDRGSIERFRDYLKTTHGGLDVLVNNAAIAYKHDATEPFGEQAENTIRVNFTGTLQACHILFPLLRPGARVVNVSSCVGHLTKVPSDDLKKKFASPELTEEELCQLMNQFVNAAKSGTHSAEGWPNSTYMVSKVGVSALTRIQQREFDKDSRSDIVINSVHPGYVDTDMTSHKGPLTIEEGAVGPTFCALLPPNVKEPRGGYVWHDTQIVDWVNGPLPSAY